MPFCPYNLGAIFRHDYICHRIGTSVDGKGYRGRVFRIYFRAACKGNADNNICIHAVGIVGSLQLCFGSFAVAYNTNAEGGENVRIRYFAVVVPLHAGYPKSAVSRKMESGRFWWVRLGSLLRRVPPDIWL